MLWSPSSCDDAVGGLTGTGTLLRVGRDLGLLGGDGSGDGEERIHFFGVE